VKPVYRWVYQPCGCVILTSRPSPVGCTMECPFGCGGSLACGDALYDPGLAKLLEATEDDRVVEVAPGDGGE